MTLQPGEFAGSPLARCPSGSTVVGTGFNGPFDPVGGFVLAYGSFVGGFFENESSIPLDAYVQAICAKVGGARASASVADNLDRFEEDVARAERLAAAS